jgi:hypothetical protein
MVNVRHYRPAGTTPDAPALALFQKQWQLYRKVRFDAANFPPSYSVDPYPDKTVQTVWQDQRRWVWFVQQGVWSFVPALYKAVTGNEVPRASVGPKPASVLWAHNISQRVLI